VEDVGRRPPGPRLANGVRQGAGQEMVLNAWGDGWRYGLEQGLIVRVGKSCQRLREVNHGLSLLETHQDRTGRDPEPEQVRRLSLLRAAGGEADPRSAEQAGYGGPSGNGPFLHGGASGEGNQEAMRPTPLRPS